MSRYCSGSQPSYSLMNSKTFTWWHHYSIGGMDVLHASTVATYTAQGLFHSQLSPGHRYTTSASYDKICRFHAIELARIVASNNLGQYLQSSHSRKKWIPQTIRIPFSFIACPATAEGRAAAEAGFAGTRRTRRGGRSWISVPGGRSGGFGWRVSY